MLTPALAQSAGPVLVVGDSLSAAYGLETDAGWVRLLDRRLEQSGYPLEVINVSVSGETTRGARTRLPDLLERYGPSVVLLQLGGNDGLRGIDPRAMERNLDRMVEMAQSQGARVLLMGVRLPTNYGKAYTRKFREVYQHVAERHDIALVPRLLEGVARRDELMQSDRIHPNEQAQPTILGNVWPRLQPLLDAVSDRKDQAS